MRGHVGQTIDSMIAALKRPFRASGVNHSSGMVPDPGRIAGTTRVLREDAQWAAVVGPTAVPATSVVSETSFDQAPSVGVSPNYARADHSHGTPPEPEVGGSAGHTIQDEGTPLTARTNLNFLGASVTVTDDAGNDATVVTIEGGAVGLCTPQGHDPSLLPGVVSHWQYLASAQGGTSMPDVFGNHNATAALTIRGAGAPFGSDEHHIVTNNAMTLANPATLITEARDASCYFMAWIALDYMPVDSIVFNVAGSGETAATNVLFQLKINSGAVSHQPELIWEQGAGVDVVSTFRTIAGGNRHICVAREHNTGVGTSTAHFWIDGVRIDSQAGKTNPTSGTSATGAMCVSPSWIYLGDCVWGSGAIPTDAQVKAQWERGVGICDDGGGGGGGGSGTVTSITPGTDLDSTPDPITTSGTINHAVSGVTAGTYGSSSLVPVITVNARGHVTAASTAAVSGGAGTVTSITAGVDLSSSPNPIVGSGTIDHDNSGVAAGTYGSATLVPVITVNARGHVTAASTAAVTAGPSFSDDETITGAIDGVNNTFTLAHTPSPAASLQFFRNGICLKSGVGFTLSGATVTTLSGYTPGVGAVLAAWFRW